MANEKLSREETFRKEIDEIINDTYGGGIHRKANKILLLSGEFREKADEKTKEELHKLGRAAVLLETHEDLLLAIRQSAQNDITFRVDQTPHGHENENRSLSLNIHVGDIHIDKHIEPLVIREKEISDELKNLNIDYSFLISWLRKCIQK